MKRDLAIKTLVFCTLVGFCVAVRLLSELPNFSAVAAASLFAGFYFRHRAVALALPLCVMTISDQFLGGYTKGVMAAVYAAMLVPMAWSSLLRQGLTPLRVGAGAVSSSVTFFLCTNFAVWLAWYAHTWPELVRCYTVALPFFGFTLASDVLFSAAFFGLYVLASRWHAAADTQRAALEAVAS